MYAEAFGKNPFFLSSKHSPFYVVIRGIPFSGGSGAAALWFPAPLCLF
jgi:hypothetical protein